MDKLEIEINKITLKIDEIEDLQEKDYEEWTSNEMKKFGNHDQLREEKRQLRKKEEQLRKKEEQLRDEKKLLMEEKMEEKKKQSDLLIQKQKNQQEIASKPTAAPKQVLMDLLGFDIETSPVNFSRPSVTLNVMPTDEITYIIPLMKFVCREGPAQALYNTLDDYLNWKANRFGEPEKNIKYVTVVGTAGKGKTTFARRFIDLEYTGKHSTTIKDCRESNRRYRVACSDFDINKDAETQLSFMILYEAFKHCSKPTILPDYINEFHRKFQKLSLADALELIVEKFGVDSNLEPRKRLLIINLDETNRLLNNDLEKMFFQELLRLLRNASQLFTLLTILSGTHSVDLLDQIQVSQCRFVNIELSLIELSAAEDVILGMTANPSKYTITRYLNYLLRLCGGIGRYLELAIIQMSIMGCADMDNTIINGFKLNGYEHFLTNMQTSNNIETLLDKLTTAALAHYPNVFSRFQDVIELLSCYTLFQWTVERDTMIKTRTNDQKSVGDLEKEGLIFLQPIHNGWGGYICTIPFITLYWALKYKSTNLQIPFLKDIKSYVSPDESENNSLHIMMIKLWGLTQKNSLPADSCTIWLSELFNLRDGQPDVKIKFRPEFSILDAPNRIDLGNYTNFKNYKSIAFLNAKGATFTDAVIFCEPMIGIQEKQSVVAKRKIVDGREPAKFNNESFQIERAKFPADGIFVLISDAKQGSVVLGEKDIFIDYESFIEFAGPLIALRKLYCTNQLNQEHKRLKRE